MLLRESRTFQVLIVCIALMLAVILGVLVWLSSVRVSPDDQFRSGLTALATLASPAGNMVGTVTLQQGSTGIVIAVEAVGLPPGGHAFVIHETGSCLPDFSAAGGHFGHGDADHGFIHPTWKRASARNQGGDLPNIYAAADGTVRADFLTSGITLDTGFDHSLFDADGSAFIVYELPDLYSETEIDTGQRIACGVIAPS